MQDAINTVKIGVCFHGMVGCFVVGYFSDVAILIIKSQLPQIKDSYQKLLDVVAKTRQA